jgi:DNA-binding XRE family transcriptional regulator
MLERGERIVTGVTGDSRVTLVTVQGVRDLREANIFGETIRSIRTERGWTQEDLAEAAKLTATYVGQVERGDKVPSLTVVLKLARGLSVPPGDLLAGFSTSVLKSLRL